MKKRKKKLTKHNTSKLGDQSWFKWQYKKYASNPKVINELKLLEHQYYKKSQQKDA